MSIALVASFLLQVAAPDSTALRGVRSPAYAPDGRLAMSIDGDILVQLSPGAALKRVTTGLPWDRDPAWTPDGKGIVFATDRDGNFELYRVQIAQDGTPGAIERITNTKASNTAPTVAANGTIAFVRGNGNAGRIWLRAVDGTEKRLNATEQTESDPQFSRDGAKLAYITSSEATRRVIVQGTPTIDKAPFASVGVTANSDKNAEAVAWSPNADRIAISSRTGLFIISPTGQYANFASARHGDLAWSADGRTFAVAEHDEVSVGYNGDPDRLGDRTNAERNNAKDRFYFVTAPVAPDFGLAEQSLSAPRDRALQNADAYDRVWERSAKLYFSAADAQTRRVQWEAAKGRHRAAAIAAKNDDELQAAIYAMLKERPPLRTSASGRAAVSSAHPVSTAAGVEILKAGGNVVDAAVAVSFALGVVEPDASGVGGYGEMVVALNTMQKPTLFEFMSRVPEDAGLSNSSLLQNGRYPSDGPVLVNVPGTTAGMYAAWQKYGSKKVPWKDLLAPAIRAARDGYEVSEGLATTLATEQEHYAKYEGSKALFFRNGRPVVAGDTIRNPGLQWVLEHIAKDGADGFYKGEVAQKWVTDLHSKGNAMKTSDLARYFAPEREPVSGTYRGYTLYSSAPPVSGGAELVGRLNLLEQFPTPRNYVDDANTLHAVLSAWFLVPTTRNRIADPALWPVDVAPIIDRDTARYRWTCFDPNKSLKPADLRGETLACAKGTKTTTTEPGGKEYSARNESPCGPEHAAEMTFCHSSGTTAFTVADNEGNMVAVTQTLGTWGGNFYVTPGLGFLSNDKLTSYGTDPTQYGSRLPFARHGSTLAPTIAFKGKKPIFAIGAAGNAWITSAVYQGLIGALDYGLDPQQALELPRFLPGGGGGGGGGRGGAPGAGGPPAAPQGYNIQLEDGFSPEVIKKLRALGYELTFVSLRGELREGYGAAVSLNGKTVMAGADPRRAGAAGAVK